MRARCGVSPDARLEDRTEEGIGAHPIVETVHQTWICASSMPVRASTSAAKAIRRASVSRHHPVSCSRSVMRAPFGIADAYYDGHNRYWQYPFELEPCD